MGDQKKPGKPTAQSDPLETVEFENSTAYSESLNYSVGDGNEAALPQPESVDPPKSIGRYRIDRLLGQGGFGRVYLAHDDELQRQVAVKVPHRHRLETSEDVQRFLREARTLASLEHPGVVPVHDVGHTDDGLCFVVSRYIDGTDLAERIKKSV